MEMGKGFRTGLIALAIVAAIGLALWSFFGKNYNQMVAMDEEVKSQWGQVQNAYQRRMDLIPNLVATVKGYASHESDVLTGIAEARSKAGGVMQVSDEVLKDPEAFKRFQAAQNELGSALQRLLVVSENYPELKADQNFLALQDELEGTENRISVERGRFNEKAKAYNVYIRQFPRSIVAGMGGFREKAYFSADSAAEKAPTVKF